MYDPDKHPRRPAVLSQTSALAEVTEWVRANKFDTIRDGDGLDWRLLVELGPELPQKVRLTAGEEAPWEVRFRLEATVSGDEFVATGTLDPRSDRRTLELIDDAKLPLRMRPTIYQARGETDAKRLLAEILPKFRDTMGRTSLQEVKRGLVHRWLDDQGEFSSRISKTY